ncbi:imidazolonepropionase [Mycobacterium sp. 21AC1]|uniref:imidazolonepropionase n=1 Tax=[Mycobacterium] appelbergii TaxID=2939269 RepID=UPI0029390C2A|nr:imidazolonepropionase [Mycobacterium sp. 21AC1]MDV3127291.1 imidazolonepropionase [Mycobacterium sp. 21AC1]
MTVLYDNIGELVTNDPTQGDHSKLGILTEAALLVDDAQIAWVGPRAEAPAADRRVDCQHRAVIPGFVDSHAHLVFDGDRAAEFAARMAGQPYDGGGIATTVRATRAATDDVLAANVARLARELHDAGVTTFETKSGYGLNVEDELRSLRVARTFTTETTFLGAHVVPPEYNTRRDEYVDLVCTAMLAACAPHARWIDVFCDRGAFDVDEARAILTAGIDRGLQPRLHAGQLGPGGGIKLAVDLDAASVDHCTYATDDDIDALAGGSTVATLLPGAEFSTRAQWPDGRRFLDAGVTVALATDCNPGSSYTTSMPFCIALAVRDMHLTPAEALWAATAGGAAALRRNDIGMLAPGNRADFVQLQAPTYLHLAYRPGVDLIGDTVLGGHTSARG